MKTIFYLSLAFVAAASQTFAAASTSEEKAAIAAMTADWRAHGETHKMEHLACRVIQDWARCDYDTPGWGYGGGSAILHSTKGAWKVVGGSTEARASDLEKLYRVPASIANQFCRPYC